MQIILKKVIIREKQQDHRWKKLKEVAIERQKYDKIVFTFSRPKFMLT